MSFAMANELTSTRRRPRPGPGATTAGYRVAPPVVEAYTPWVTILEPAHDAGALRWATGPDGVLLPVRDGDGTDAGRGILGRIARLVRR